MNIQEQLRSLGLSVTPVRLAVWETLNNFPHSNASYIFETVQAKLQTTSIQAVYKNLNALVEYNLVREIKPKGMPALYETRVGDNHHHLVCRSCGHVEDTDWLKPVDCLNSTDSKNYIIDEVEIVFWGICSNCQTNIKNGEN